MKKSWLLPAAAVAGGVIGLPLRRAYLARGFDGVTGLPVEGSRYGLLLYGLTAVVLAVLLVLSRGKHRSFDKQFSSAFYARKPFWFVVAAAGGVLLFASGLLGLMDYFRPEAAAWGAYGAEYVRRSARVLRVLLGVLSLLAGVGVYFTALNTRKKGEYRSGWITLPGFVCCAWVMSGYQDWAKDPVMGHYLFPLLAVLLAMIACYLIPAFAFGKGRVTAALFFASSAAAVSIMLLGDGEALYLVSLRVGLSLWLLAMAGCLAENAARPAPPAVLPEGCTPADCASCPGCPPPADEKNEPDNA